MGFHVLKRSESVRLPKVNLDYDQWRAMKGYAESQRITLREAQWQANQFLLLFQLKYGTLSKNKPLSRREWINAVDEIFTGKKFR